jgi:hypothetical protein
MTVQMIEKIIYKLNVPISSVLWAEGAFAKIDTGSKNVEGDIYIVHDVGSYVIVYQAIVQTTVDK